MEAFCLVLLDCTFPLMAELEWEQEVDSQGSSSRNAQCCRISFVRSRHLFLGTTSSQAADSSRLEPAPCRIQKLMNPSFVVEG